VVQALVSPTRLMPACFISTTARVPEEKVRFSFERPRTALRSSSVEMESRTL